MPNRSRHPLPQFAVLLGIAAPLLLVFCVSLDRTCVDDPEGAGFLASEHQLFRNLSTSGDLLEEMIERDEVTWDPTNGVRIGRVLSHLKRSNGPKLLLVGSSQLLVVRDDRSRSGIARRLDRVLDERLGSRATVYNLSLGGMTLAERTWVLERAVRLIDFDYIVIGMTLWDSVSDEVRPWLARPRDPLPGSPPTERPAIDWPTPAALNRAITTRLSGELEATFPFLEHRTAIRRWLKDELARALGRGHGTIEELDIAPRTVEQTGAIPVHYEYPEGEQASILARVEEFFSTLRTVRADSGAAILVLLTPFRQDTERPAYSPPGFYDRYRRTVERACARDRFLFLDASSLLDRRHFGRYADGPDAGKIDVLHFDATGHDELAGAIEASPLFDRSSRAAG